MGRQRLNQNCTVCGDPAVSRQLCVKHYTRWKRHGDPLVALSPHASLKDRIEAKLDTTGTCWLWQGHINNKGYGVVGKGGKNGRLLYVHRAYYEIMVGPIPEGLELDHVRSRGCEHKHCARPDHLEPVTHKENMGRKNSERGSCLRGHALPEAGPSGKRICKACVKIRNAARYSNRA